MGVNLPGRDNLRLRNVRTSTWADPESIFGSTSFRSKSSQVADVKEPPWWNALML